MFNSPAPLFGLVLAGGKSSRTGKDKAGICYFGQPQWKHCFNVLLSYCERVFVSCRKDQVKKLEISVPVILDGDESFGPATGLLAAHAAHPSVAFLVFAVDMPFCGNKELDALVAHRSPTSYVTCFIDPATKGIEPLCAIWEPLALSTLAENPSRGPRHVLEVRAGTIPAADIRRLRSINSANQQCVVQRP